MKISGDFKTFLNYLAIATAVTVLCNLVFLWRAMWLFDAIVPFELAVFTLMSAWCAKVNPLYD